MRLIDAEWLKELYQPYESYNGKELAVPIGAILANIDDAPTIDAVSVVRCKECKFSEVWESTAGNELYCEKQRVCPYDWGALTEFYVKADDFCSYGEREGK